MQIQFYTFAWLDYTLFFYDGSWINSISWRRYFTLGNLWRLLKVSPVKDLHTFWPWAFSLVKLGKIGLLSFVTTENGLSNISVRESDIENLKKSIYLFCDDVSNPPWFLGPLELSAGLGGGSGSEERRPRHCTGGGPGTWLAWLTPSLQPARPSLQQQDYPIRQRQSRALHYCKNFQIKAQVFEKTLMKTYIQGLSQ